jgi:hypothetical protein
MNVPKIGQLITMNEQRDAIHIAVLPVTAFVPLAPGQPVRFAVQGNAEIVMACEQDHPYCIGIIDPFLPLAVSEGEHCWVFVTPNTITGLRHEWTHPLVDGEDRRAIAEFWLREFAPKVPIDYDDMMLQLRERGGVYIGEDLNYGEDLSDENIDILKKHFLTLTGIQLGDVGFRCAC